MPRRDLVIIPDDEPGVLARMGKAAGDAGLNIEAFSAFTGGGKGVVHLLVDDDEKGVQVFRDAGFDVRASRRVAVAPMEDRPGALGDACQRLADEGVNIEQAYIGGNNTLVVVCDDVDKAKDVLGIE